MRTASPPGDADPSCKQGCVSKITTRFGKWGGFSFLPPMVWCGKEEGAEWCPGWTRAGGTRRRASSVEHSFLHTCITQALASCTEELKIEISCSNKISLLTYSPYNTYMHITLTRCTKPHRT